MNYLKTLIFLTLILTSLSLNSSSFNLTDFLNTIHTYGPLTKSEHDEIFSYLNNSEVQEIINSINKALSISKEPNCLLCTMGVTFTNSFISDKLFRKKGATFIYEIAKLVCEKLIHMNREVCDGAIGMYGEIVVSNVLNFAFKPEGICYAIGACDKPIPYIHIEDYAKRVLEDKPPTIKEKINPDAPTIKMLQFADVHLDLNYKEGAIAECDKPICCHDMPNISDISKIPNENLAGLYGYMKKCDANLLLLQEFAKKAKEYKPDFVIYSGDNICHQVWKVSQEEVSKVTKVIVDTVSEQIGKDVPIYPTIGNHEGAPVDQYYGEETELLQGLADAFKPYLTDESYETFRKYGYYSQLHKNTKIRIIQINCLICDSFNWYLLTTQMQAKEMYDWLEKELSKAEKNKETVYILDHFPQESSLHNINCGRRLRILMDRYQNIIKGYFSGHSHNEYIELVHEWDSKEPFLVNYAASGIVTEYNPSFRVYDIDSDTLQLKDYVQYRFDLDKSNKERKPIWFESYVASKLFNVTYLNEVDKISKMELEGDYVIKKYCDTQKGYGLAHDQGELKYNKCDLTCNDFIELGKCSGQDLTHNRYYILNILFGEWKEREIY